MYRRRKGVVGQAQEKMMPDSQKSPSDKATESASGAGDKVAGAVQPGALRYLAPPTCPFISSTDSTVQRAPSLRLRSLPTPPAQVQTMPRTPARVTWEPPRTKRPVLLIRPPTPPAQLPGMSRRPARAI